MFFDDQYLVEQDAQKANIWVMEQNICIFCGARKTTKEHIWGKWLQPIAKLSHDPKDRGTHTVTKKISEKPIVSPGQFTNAGNTLQHTSKIVCKECNNGWMSQIENRMRPLFTKYFVDGEEHFSSNDLETISIWVHLKFCLHQRAYPPSNWVSGANTAKIESQIKLIWRRFSETQEVPYNIYLCRSGECYWGGHNMIVLTEVGERLGSQDSGEVISIRYAAYFTIGPMTALISSIDFQPVEVLQSINNKLDQRFFIRASPNPFDTQLLNSRRVEVTEMDKILKGATSDTQSFRQIGEIYKG